MATFNLMCLTTIGISFLADLTCLEMNISCLYGHPNSRLKCIEGVPQAWAPVIGSLIILYLGGYIPLVGIFYWSTQGIFCPHEGHPRSEIFIYRWIFVKLPVSSWSDATTDNVQSSLQFVRKISIIAFRKTLKILAGSIVL